MYFTQTHIDIYIYTYLNTFTSVRSHSVWTCGVCVWVRHSVFVTDVGVYKSVVLPYSNTRINRFVRDEYARKQWCINNNFIAMIVQ